MTLHWRHSEKSTGEKLEAVTGTERDLDGTPVAMFRQVNGRELGLSMQEIGELVDHHWHILAWGDPDEITRRALERECDLARSGADAIARDFNELLDDRLRPRRIVTEPGPSEERQFDALMKRLRANTPKGAS